jgi:hypothetical protein
MIRSITVAVVIKMQAITVVMLPLNFALTAMQRDMMRFLNTTTVDAPTEAESGSVACNARSTDTGTRNALPEHCKHMRARRAPGVQGVWCIMRYVR